MAHILVVEDDEPIRDLIAMNLALVGHTSEQVSDGNAARESLTEHAYDLVLLDVMLPGMVGFDLLPYVPNGTPVICVTARDNLPDRVRGLNLGADDYVAKPFETLELLARIEAVLRRTHRALGHFALDDTVVTLDSRVVTVAGQAVELTRREFDLLEILIRHQNIAMSRDKLLELAWGYDYEGETRTVDVHIQRLRHKLGWERRIKTVYKLGYRLEVGP